MVSHCPLCKSIELDLRERISTDKLARLYNRIFRIDIKRELNEISLIKLFFCKSCGLYFFLPPINTSEEFYQNLQKFNWYYLDEKNEYSIAAKYIKKNDRILEIGCGKGSFANKVSSINYIGLEFSQEAVTLANGIGLKVIQESIEEFSKKSKGLFDVVCAFQVLEHINDSWSFIRSSVECLKSGGLFIISVPSFDSFLSCSTNNILNLPPHHSSWWSDTCLKNVPRYFNLELIYFKHEKLADIHKEWYLKVIAEIAFRNLFKLKFSIIDLSFKWKLIGKISSIFAYFFSKGFDDPKMMPIGHSVIGVYRKY